MGLFSKLFAGLSRATSSNNDDFQLEVPSFKSEQELLEYYGGIAIEKQVDFEEVIGDNNWEVDMTQEVITFGQELTFPIQVLGTFSYSSQSWLWAWANTASGLSEHIIQQSLQLKKYGEKNAIELFKNDTFDLSIDKLHLIGIVASGMFNSSSYYVADYGQGAMVVTIKSETIDKQRTQEPYKVLTTFPQLISQFELNHKNAFKSYLIMKGYKLIEDENSVIATQNGNTIVGQFDDLSRLINLKG